MNAADTRIRDEVLAELDFDPAIDVTGIGVTVSDGLVTLSGHVERYVETVMAERAAKRIRGVKALALNLAVRRQGCLDKYADSELAKCASDILKWTTASGYRLTVSVDAGRIHVTGIVCNKYQREEAMSALRRLFGITSVTDATIERKHALPVDAKERVAAAIRRRAELAHAAIRIDVAGSKVTLDGDVDTWRQHSLAEDAAWALPGITAVDNNIAVVG